MADDLQGTIAAQRQAAEQASQQLQSSLLPQLTQAQLLRGGGIRSTVYAKAVEDQNKSVSQQIGLLGGAREQFEKSVAQVAPEYGQESYVKQEVDKVKQSVGQKLEQYKNQVEQYRQELNAVQARKDPTREQVRGAQERLELAQKRVNVYQDALSKDTPTLIKEYNSGYTDALSNYQGDIVSAQYNPTVRHSKPQPQQIGGYLTDVTGGTVNSVQVYGKDFKPLAVFKPTETVIATPGMAPSYDTLSGELKLNMPEITTDVRFSKYGMSTTPALQALDNAGASGKPIQYSVGIFGDIKGPEVGGILVKEQFKGMDLISAQKAVVSGQIKPFNSTFDRVVDYIKPTGSLPKIPTFVTPKNVALAAGFGAYEAQRLNELAGPQIGSAAKSLKGAIDTSIGAAGQTINYLGNKAVQVSPYIPPVFLADKAVQGINYLGANTANLAQYVPPVYLGAKAAEGISYLGGKITDSQTTGKIIDYMKPTGNLPSSAKYFIPGYLDVKAAEGISYLGGKVLPPVTNFLFPEDKSQTFGQKIFAPTVAKGIGAAGQTINYLGNKAVQVSPYIPPVFLADKAVQGINYLDRLNPLSLSSASDVVGGLVKAQVRQYAREEDLAKQLKTQQRLDEQAYNKFAKTAENPKASIEEYNSQLQDIKDRGYQISIDSEGKYTVLPPSYNQYNIEYTTIGGTKKSVPPRSGTVVEKFLGDVTRKISGSFEDVTRETVNPITEALRPNIPVVPLVTLGGNGPKYIGGFKAPNAFFVKPETVGKVAEFVYDPVLKYNTPALVTRIGTGALSGFTGGSLGGPTTPGEFLKDYALDIAFLGAAEGASIASKSLIKTKLGLTSNQISELTKLQAAGSFNDPRYTELRFKAISSLAKKGDQEAIGQFNKIFNRETKVPTSSFSEGLGVPVNLLPDKVGKKISVGQETAGEVGRLSERDRMNLKFDQGMAKSLGDFGAKSELSTGANVDYFGPQGSLVQKGKALSIGIGASSIGKEFKNVIEKELSSGQWVSTRTKKEIKDLLELGNVRSEIVQTKRPSLGIVEVDKNGNLINKEPFAYDLGTGPDIQLVTISKQVSTPEGTKEIGVITQKSLTTGKYIHPQLYISEFRQGQKNAQAFLLKSTKQGLKVGEAQLVRPGEVSRIVLTQPEAKVQITQLSSKPTTLIPAQSKTIAGITLKGKDASDILNPNKFFTSEKERVIPGAVSVKQENVVAQVFTLPAKPVTFLEKTASTENGIKTVTGIARKTKESPVIVRTASEVKALPETKFPDVPSSPGPRDTISLVIKDTKGLTIEDVPKPILDLGSTSAVQGAETRAALETASRASSSLSELGGPSMAPSVAPMIQEPTARATGRSIANSLGLSLPSDQIKQSAIAFATLSSVQALVRNGSTQTFGFNEVTRGISLGTGLISPVQTNMKIGLRSFETGITEIRPQVSSIEKIGTKLLPVAKSLQIPSEINIQNEFLKLNPVSATVSRNVFDTIGKSATRLETKSIELLKNKTAQELRLEPRSTIRPPRVNEPRTPPKLKTEFEIIPKIKSEPKLQRKATSQQRRIGKSFEIQVKQKGPKAVFKTVSPFAYSQEEAFAIGSAKVLGSASATFRLRESSRPLSTIGARPSPGTFALFRAPKAGSKLSGPLTYVQKERVRITSAGEKAEISLAGARARRRPSVFPGMKNRSITNIRNRYTRRNKFF